MSVRPPIPQDVDAERALLGAMLLDARLAAQLVPELRETDFYRPAHGRIFAALAAVTAEGLGADVMAVRAALERAGELEASGGAVYLSQLLDEVPTAANAATPLRLVREAARRRAIADHLVRGLDLVATSPEPAERLHAQLLGEFLGLGPAHGATGFQKLAVSDVLEDVDRSSRGEAGGLRIGFNAFDSQTQGLQPGELVLLGAAPKVGKSTVAGLIGLHVALSGQGGVGYVSAEMGNKAITERLLSALAGVPIGAMRHARERMTDAHYRRLAHASGVLAAAPFWLDDGAVPRLEDVVARVLALKAKQPTLALVVVDFLQLIQLRLKGRRGDEELEAISYGLKDLAKRAGVVVVCPTQLNQKSIEDRPDRRPLLRDISGSSGPLKAADFVALLQRPGLYADLPAGVPDHMLILVEAARRTPAFDFTLTWQATVMRGLDADLASWLRPDEPLRYRAA